MGYRRQAKRYWLVFTDPEMEGLKVLMKSVSIAQFMEITGLDDNTILGEGVTLAQGAPVAGRLARAAADAIVEWNLEDDDGNPVKPGFDALMALDMGFVQAIVKAWFEAISGVAAPLPEGSSDGGPSPEGSLHLASASRSLAS